MTNRTFRDDLRLSPTDIPRLALHFARNIAYPQLSIDDYLKQIDQLATEARAEIPPLDPVLQRAEGLAEFLFQEHGFQGNSAEYDDPRNSFFNELLDRHLGIPISLSVLYIAIAERVGIPAYGVSLPGHFIVGVRDSDQVDDLLFDPFHGGQRLSLADCKELVRRTSGYTGPFQQGWLLPARPLDTLARMLNNLRLIYVQRQWWPEAIAVTEHLRVVQPEIPELLRDLGLIHYHHKSLQLAAHYLELYLQAYPNAPDAVAIQQALQGMVEEWARQN